jgi:hypothetical protein
MSDPVQSASPTNLQIAGGSFATLVLNFGTSLATSPLSTTVSIQDFATGSNGGSGGSNPADFPTPRTGSSVAAVPLETDALPIMGSVVFMAGGLWFKRRRAQAKANLNFLNNETEKSA